MAASERALGLIGLLVIALIVALGGRPVHAGPPLVDPRAPGCGPEDPDIASRARALVKADDEPAQPRPSRARMRLIWTPASVAWPLAPVGAADGDYEALAAVLDEREAMLDGRVKAPSVRGPVALDSDQAAGVWIASLETIRVRQIGPEVPLRFIRGVDANAVVVEPGRALAPELGEGRSWELHQPPSSGALWSIEADAPTKVIVERVEPRPPRYVSVEVEQEVLDWITDDESVGGKGAGPLPLEPTDEVGHELRLHAALADELLALRGGDRKLAKAVEAWRMLAAINELDRSRPAVRPYYVRDRPSQRPVPLKDTKDLRLDVPDSRDYRLLQPGRRTIARTGPGQLRIAARTWAPVGAELKAAELRVYAGGQVIERLPLSDRAAKHSSDPDTALPKLEPLLTEDGEAVGEFAHTTIVLAPGRRDYEVELVGGPALLSIEGARRIEASLLSLKGRTPTKRARAAEGALAKSNAPARAWLELLLARETASPLPMTSEDPRFDALADHSPLLAAAALAYAAAAQELDDDAVDRAVDRVQPLLATLARDPDLDPEVRGQLRTRWLTLIAAHGRPERASALVEQVAGGADPISELPVDGLRLLAELLGPTVEVVRSPALAVLELARTRAPADEALREQTLRLWSVASRWSRRRPVPSEASDQLLRPVGEWLVPRVVVPAAERELSETWLRLEPGQAVGVRVELRADAVRRTLEPEAGEGQGASHDRMRLANIHVSTPLGDPEPALIQIDGQRWWSPQLFGVQRHRLAVSEGDHEIMVWGPPGTVAWTDLRPLERQKLQPDDVGRREQMWPLPRSTWYLPGPAVPGIVRLELRWPEDIEPRPTRITMHQHGDHPPGATPAPKTVVFDPRTPEAARAEGPLPTGVEIMTIDDEAVPVAGTSWVSPRHDVNLAIAASTDRLSFEVEGGAEIAASLSLRRGLRPGERRDVVISADEPEPELELDDLFGDLSTLDGEGMLDEIGDLSRVLLVAPDDLDRRARRAALLLMLGETGHARADLLRLSAWAGHEGTRGRAELLLAELERRFNALIEPREIVVTDPQRTDSAVLVEPALSAYVEMDRVLIDPWLELWARARATPSDETLAELDRELARLHDELRGAKLDGDKRRITRSLRVGELTRAHLLSVDPSQARTAGRAWLELYGRMDGGPGAVRDPIAVGLAAVAPLLTHLDDPASDARDAGLAFGLARELEPSYGHTSVRRLAFIAAMRSDWNTLQHSEDNAGFERLELPVSELEPSPSARIREALLVAPWPAREAEQLLPGRKGVLNWDAVPGTVTAQLWCRAERPDRAPNSKALSLDPDNLGRARLIVRVRSSGRDPVERRVELRDAELGEVVLPIERKGRHRLEVALAADPIWQCSWRTQTAALDVAPEDAELVEAHRRAHWSTAESGKAVEFVVLGPASLHVESRGIATSDAQGRPTALIADVKRVVSGRSSGVPEPGQGHLALDDEAERAVITERRRRFEVAHANGHTLLLTEAVPYRVRLRTDRGRALIRARVRRDRGDVAPPARVSIRELDPREPVVYPETFDWRSVGPATPVVARDRIKPICNRIGSLDARVTVGFDDIGNADDFLPRLGMDARIGWRRELIEDRLWLMIAGQIALRDKSPVAAGGILGIGARVDGIGARLGATLDVLSHSFLGRPETSVRLYGFVDRPIWLGRFIQLRPGLTAGLRWQSLNSRRVAMATGSLEPHPRVYLSYLENHPVLLQPELELRTYPFQDMAVWAQASMMPNLNLDPQPIDHVDVEIGLDGIGRRPRPWLPTWGLSYQLSTRLADAHRSAMVLRHRVEADVGVAVWARDTARVMLGLTNQLYLSNAASPIRDVIQLWIRVDATFGRRMRDYGPGELWFSEPWAPRAWGDSEQQAPSTQGRIPRGSSPR
ncbi:hypothetical protein ENSA5_40750 [Enhygromyxa salina]|uniref:Uncharacterized protein n=1 Tax=Enhygromyxa salina TaxID=215803 RepID=A0A2S9XNL3_9BACT|nr:hypothetical protein [Enhygromyxa salina]PRP94456.1 hypothetical protein ENSA5_40750 [Enhygromyxa salina]